MGSDQYPLECITMLTEPQSQPNVPSVSTVCKRGLASQPSCGPPLENGASATPCDDDAHCNISTDFRDGQCVCNKGFVGDGYRCQQKDFCNDPDTKDMVQCASNARCVGKPCDMNGNYSCMCNTGYTGNGFNCSALNMCEDGSHACDNHSTTCQYTGPGSYSCRCKQTPIKYLPFNETMCKELDRCQSTYWSGCDPNASATLAFQGTVLPAMLSMLVLILKLILEIALQ